MEFEDMPDLDSGAHLGVGVQVPPWPLITRSSAVRCGGSTPPVRTINYAITLLQRA